MYGKKHLIAWIYWAGIALTVSLPVIVFLGVMLNNFRIHTIDEAKLSLQQSAGLIRDLARQRFDTIQFYQYQEQNYLMMRVNQIADTFAVLGRQFELASIRRFLPGSTAQELLVTTLDQIKFGEMGENFVLSQEGAIIFHRKLPSGFDMKSYPFINDMIAKKDGVIRYWWKNPGEQESRERLTAYRTIFSWNWIVCSSVTIDEAVDSSFESMSLNAYYDYIKSLQLNWEGQASILTKDYKVLAHPTYTGSSWENVPGAAEMINLREGICTFKDALSRKWYGAASPFDPWGWILTVSAREDEILRSYYRLRNLIISGGALSIGISLVLLRWVIRRMGLSIYQHARRHSAAK